MRPIAHVTQNWGEGVNEAKVLQLTPHPKTQTTSNCLPLGLVLGEMAS